VTTKRRLLSNLRSPFSRSLFLFLGQKNPSSLVAEVAFFGGGGRCGPFSTCAGPFLARRAGGNEPERYGRYSRRSLLSLLSLLRYEGGRERKREKRKTALTGAVESAGPDALVVDVRAHHRVQDLLLLLPVVDLFTHAETLRRSAKRIPKGRQRESGP